MPTYSARLASVRTIPDWLKYGFLTTSVFFVCWGGAIAYWRTTRSNPAAPELLLYLFGLPACLVLVFFVGRKLLTRPGVTPVPTTASTPVKAPVTPSQTRSLAILAAALRLPHGASPEELASAIADSRARADLDKELIDDEGFPVMAARCSEAVDEVLQEEIREWLALNGMAELDFSDEQWRALMLGSAVVAELAAQAAGPSLYQVDNRTSLQLVPILPIEWEVAHCRAMSMWLKQTVARYGWPDDRVIVAVNETDRSSDPGPAAIFKGFAHNAAATDVPLIAMVVACASHVGDETVAQWAANGSLFTSSRPQGHIPGEGAAGLLISNQSHLAEAETMALLDGIEEAQRDASADESKRSDPSLLGELSERALRPSGTNASDVPILIADTGHRSSRVIELMMHVSAALPQLDETGDVVRIGVASGTCGAVPFMTALALGRHYVLACEAPVLCVSNEDPYHRVVALMRSANASQLLESIEP
ncbi:MAG: hypothetical protein ACXV7F_11555 [Methylomonas sp.]